MIYEEEILVGWTWENIRKLMCSQVKNCIIVNTNRSNGGVYTVIFGNCKIEKKDFSVHVVVTPKDVKDELFGENVFMAEQLTTIDGKQILVKAGYISAETRVLTQFNEIMFKQLGM